MPKIIYVYQKQEQKIKNIQVMKIHLKYDGNPRSKCNR